MMQRVQYLLVALLVTAVLVSARPADANDAALEASLRAAFEKGELRGLHSVHIVLEGQVFADLHFDGKDERWGRPLGTRSFDADALHDLRSVTKSIVGLLYGIALAEGSVPSVESRLIDAFPEYSDLASDEGRDDITIAHTLSMMMGTAWDESLPYTDPRNSEIAMELADDRYRFVLDRPMVEAPGTKWTYNGGATAVIARLIAKGTGQPVDEFARDRLFAPLGIENFEWIRGADGEPSAASGLRLSVTDLARIGQMIVDGGRSGDRQIVPENWLNASFTPRADAQSLRYGYFWWLAPGEGEPAWVAGFGNGGQRMSINRRLKLVVVIFAGNYNQPDAWKLPVKVITDHFVPAFQKR